MHQNYYSYMRDGSGEAAVSVFPGADKAALVQGLN